MSDKAGTLTKYGEAVTRQIPLDGAPRITQAPSEPLASVRDLSITSTEGAPALPKTVADDVEQLDPTLRNLMSAGLTDMVGSRLPDSDASANHTDSADHDGATPTAVVKHSEH